MTAKVIQGKVLEQRGDYVIVELPAGRFGVRMAGATEHLSIHEDVASARGQIHNYQVGDERRRGKPLLHKGKPFRTDGWGNIIQD